MTILQPMPPLQIGLPSYTNDDFSGSFPASCANNETYGGTASFWRCAAEPSGGANDGTLTQSPGFTVAFPVWWALDMSTVPVAQRQQVLFAWQNDFSNGPYNPDLIGTNPGNLPKDYTIDYNTGAGGGAAPTNGWVNLATVTGNVRHSRQHLVNMSGANWIRINVTAAHGSPSNNNVAMKVAVHDAHLACTSWFVAGDSIVQRAFVHDETSGIGQIVPKQVHGLRPAYYPYMESGGEGGYTATDYQAQFATWLPDFPGKFVVLALGTNDANAGGAPVTNYTAKMQSMITTAVSAGKTVIIPHIPWGSTANILANGPTINGYIDALIAANPGVLAGPDLWAFFSTHQSDISNDGIHPTDPLLSQGNGYVDYRTQWVNWLVANIYFNTLNTDTQTAYKVRTVLNTDVHTSYKVRTVLKTHLHTSFKVQLSGVTSKAYLVSQVATSPFARPLSTVTSTATVVDESNVAQTNLTATCTITYPDTTTATGQVYNIGSGQYEVIYETKGAGTVTELWTFTDSLGSSAEYQHSYPCYFENS